MTKNPDDLFENLALQSKHLKNVFMLFKDQSGFSEIACCSISVWCQIVRLFHMNNFIEILLCYLLATSLLSLSFIT